MAEQRVTSKLLRLVFFLQHHIKPFLTLLFTTPSWPISMQGIDSPFNLESFALKIFYGAIKNECLLYFIIPGISKSLWSTITRAETILNGVFHRRAV